MWIFENPKTYPEMLKKIAWTMFFIVIIILCLLSTVSTVFSKLMETLSFGIKYEYHSIKILISYLYIPLFFALLENITKLHDKISDAFRIRFRFDKKVIIHTILESLNLMDKYQQVNIRNRDQIMKAIFYKYAGYANPEIDPHLIFMAFGAWSWYWILIDTMFIMFILIVIVAIYSFTWKIIIGMSCIFLVLGILSLCVKQTQCMSYARQEVQAILENKQRNHAIMKYLNTLS